MTLLPLPDAALRLGLSQSSLRRRLKAGAVRGERRPTSSGFAWWVAVPDSPDGGVPAASQTPTATPDLRSATQDAPQEPPRDALLSDRAAEMARYSRELLAPVLARLEQQAERIGRLEAELEGYRGQQDAPPAGGQTGRPWWRRLWAPG